MKEIVRKRTLRPSTRLESSKNYKVDTKTVSGENILLVQIDHESKPFRKTYKFKGSDVAHKNSIRFQVREVGSSFEIIWSGATPINGEEEELEPAAPSTTHKKLSEKNDPEQPLNNTKTSFNPISNSDTTVLILGTIPGDKSLELNEYYGHKGNKFWKVIAAITENNVPTTYSGKKQLLSRTKIGIWDVAHRANRKGSLDSAIKDEKANDLENFIAEHKNLRVIGFNGKTSETLFDKHFTRKKEIKYISLPSTSPANTGIDFAGICAKWKQILEND